MVAFVFLIALSVGRFSLALDWPQFRGPTGDGVSNATNVPLHWSATDQVVWKQEIPGNGWSSPVLSQNKLYLTTAVETAGAVSLRALCLNASDGRVHWNVELFQPEASAAKAMHSKNSLASPTPIVNGDRLYVHFGHMGTAALDLEGNIVWTQSELKYQPRHGNGGSPVLIDDVLAFSCDSEQDPFLAGLGTTNGRIRWKVNRETPAIKKFSFSTPIVVEVDGATQIVSPGSGFVGAYDPKDGKEIWRVHYGEGYSVVPRPVFAHGLVFVASGFEKPILLAIDPQGARGDVTATQVKWQHEKGAPLTPSMLVAGDELYFVSDAGVASCLDARSGKVHWTKRLGGNFSASPVCADGRVYFQSEEGVTHVIETNTKFNSLATNDIEERTLASPAISNGTLFLRSESHLWRIGQSDRFSQQGRRPVQIDRN